MDRQTKFLLYQAFSNLLKGTSAMLLNPLIILLVSIAIFITMSFKYALAYVIVSIILRRLLYKWLKSHKTIVKENNIKVNYNLELFVERRGTIKQCISTVSYFVAEQINYSADLFLGKKKLNYISVIIASYIVVLHYFYFRNFQNFSKDSAKELNARVYEYIFSNNHTFSSGNKKYLKENSNEIINEMVEKNDAEKLKNFTSSKIEKKIFGENNIYNGVDDFIYKWLSNTEDKFYTALDRRI